jgi:CrcB protein
VEALKQIALVAVGSAVGGLTRWGLGLAAGRWLGTAFPWGTLFINVTGCLFLGWIATLLRERSVLGWLSADDLKLLLAVGFSGGYTTFSTFAYEANTQIKEDNGWLSVIYLAASVVLGLVAVRAGEWLARGK